MRGKGFVVLMVVTTAVVLAASMALRDESPAPRSGQLLLDNLLVGVNDVVRVDIISAGESFKLERNAAGVWTIPSRDGFPATPERVRKLLVGMAGLERLQAKTGKPERFAELGLRDPALKDSRAVGFSLLDSAATVVADLIVGERRPAKGDATRSEYFVRVPGEDKSWLVVGSLPEDSGEAVDWLAPRVASISGSRIARARITHGDGEVVTVERKTPSADGFEFVELPEGQQPAAAWRINDIGRLLADLSLVDVQPASDVPTDAKQIEFVTETFDGLRIRMHLYDNADEPLARLTAEFDESLITQPQEKPRPDDVDEVRNEVKALNERWSRWAYVLSRFKGDTVRRRQKDLIKEAEKAPPPAAG
jgi:hypothetical protein